MKKTTKQNINFWIGLIIIIIGLITGLWLGIGVMFIGGIIDIVHGAVGWELAKAICKIIFSELGLLPFWIGWIIGLLFITKS